MSSHNGVSCDSCLKANFPDRRYKCLTCENFDLCGLCYDINSESQNHLNTHPMQCILTKTAYELFYAGEPISYRTIVSLTCPYCGVCGFIPHTLLIHCLEKHSIMASEDKTSQTAVMCPICVINPLEGNQSRFVSLADHIAREHDDIDSSIGQTQQFDDKKEDFDPDDDEDEGLPLYVLAEQLFIKEENRRQRLAQTMIRNDFHSVLNGNITSQQRSLSRHSRGDLRVPRTTTGSFRIPFDTSIPSDPYTAILFSQDSLFDFESPSSDSITIAPFFLTSSVPTHIPSVESATNGRIIQKKSILSNTKQRRFNYIQQPVISSESSTSNYQLPTSLNNLHFLTDIDLTTENSSKNSENDPRSLLGKILKSDDDNQSIQIPSEQNHPSFLQSLFLSSMHISINKKQLS